jgi:energy-coupling factor transport system ATP-binding protein
MQLFSGTVEEEVAFGPRNLALAPGEVTRRVDYALAAAGCVHLRHRIVRHLSGGEQQRVAIAAVLAMRPAALILDEPTANLDAEGVRLIVGALARLRREFGMTVVVIEHRLEPFVPLADRLVWLADGRVVADGLPEEQLARILPVMRCDRPKHPQRGAPLVSLSKVAAGYNGRKVLRDCSLTLYRGDFAALIGSNGAGKTTVARVLSRLLKPRGGRVIWHTDGAHRGVGFVQQSALHQLVCDTVGEEVWFGPRNLGRDGRDDLAGMLGQMGLHGLSQRRTQALSVGQQQRTAVAATLSLNPSLLILDEPTVGQDQQHLMRVMDLVSELNQAGQTVLLITHDRLLVQCYARRVWLLRKGAVEETRTDAPPLPG